MRVPDEWTQAQVELHALEVRIFDAVSSVSGYVTAAENDRLDALRAIVGARFDAVNRYWIPLED